MTSIVVLTLLFLFSTILCLSAIALYRPVKSLNVWLITMMLSAYPLHGFVISLIGFYLTWTIQPVLDLPVKFLWALSLIQFLAAQILFIWPVVIEFFNHDFFDFELRKSFGLKSFQRYHFSIWQSLVTLPFTALKSESIAGVKARDGSDLALRIWRANDPQAPAVIQIFGGGYTIGSVDQLPLVNEFFVTCGYHVIALDYRLLPKFNWPTPRSDIQDGWAFVINNLPLLKIDPAFFVFAGRSAGAHLALDAVSKLQGNQKIKGVLNLYAPVDWLGVETLSYHGDILDSQKTVPQFFGGTFADTREVRRDASPIHSLHQDFPAVLSIHGERDPIVPWTQSRDYQHRCSELGVRNYTLILRFATHVFDYNLGSPAGQRAKYAIKHFLSSLKES